MAGAAVTYLELPPLVLGSEEDCFQEGGFSGSSELDGAEQAFVRQGTEPRRSVVTATTALALLAAIEGDLVCMAMYVKNVSAEQVLFQMGLHRSAPERSILWSRAANRSRLPQSRSVRLRGSSSCQQAVQHRT